ncbi:VanZ family protein [Leucothrix sargassi]|nr:VanZ family protein [Leucothrix sargassi]
MSHYSALLGRCIAYARYLRGIQYVKYGFFVALVFLMGAGLKVATVPLMFPESLDVSDKTIHLVVFFGFAFLADIVSSREPFWLWKALPVALYGIGVEVLQLFSPDRSFSVADIAADLAGILLYWFCKQLVYWIAKRRSSLI